MYFQHVINSLVYGGIYAMIAVSYALVFSILGLVNLTHGPIMSVGALVSFTLLVDYNQNLIVAVIGALIVTALLGLLTERIAVRPVRAQNLPRYYALLTTFGLGMIITNLCENITLSAWPQEVRLFPMPFTIKQYTVFGAKISNLEIAMLLVILTLMIGLSTFIKYTWTGRALRVTSQNHETAELMGVNTSRVISGTFMVAAAGGAITGTMLAIYYSYISANIGVAAGMKGFISSLLGGQGLIAGAVLGGFLLGILESLASGLINTGYRDLIAFGSLVLILLVRPTGLLGSKEEDRA